MNLSFSNYTEQSLSLTWTPGDDHSERIRYKIDLLIADGENIKTVFTANTYWLFSNLTSGTNYTATITAVLNGTDEERTSLVACATTYTSKRLLTC